MTRTYDVACEHLAEHFIRDLPMGTDENVKNLAQILQDTIEDWIEAMEEEMDK